MKVNRKITEDIEINQFKWYEQVQRMNASRIPKKVPSWMPQGKRKSGRARLSWRENTDKDIRERGVNENF